MLDVIRSIPGPHFLVLFPLLVITAILIGRRIISGASSESPPLDPSIFPPSTIAAMRGGWELVLKTVIFGMWRGGAIELVPEPETTKTLRILGMESRIKTKSAAGYLFRRAEGAQAPTDRVEMAVWKFLESDRQPDTFFNDPTLRSFVETHINQVNYGLEQKGLIRSDDSQKRANLVFFCITVLVMGFGVTKAALGIIHHRPTVFLFIMLAAAFVALMAFLKPRNRLTADGKRFLKQLNEQFAWLKDAIKGSGEPGVDPAYAFALFGTSALAGTFLYAPFSEAFPAQSAGGCGGGSCGGSGCGGGSCGGGGCGGCGGGGD